jgi:hypothetical protein
MLAVITSDRTVRDHERIRHGTNGGPSGTRTRDLRIKSPAANCTIGHESGCENASPVASVPMVYVAQRAIDQSTPVPPWTLLLQAAQRGDEAQARALGAQRVTSESVPGSGRNTHLPSRTR